MKKIISLLLVFLMILPLSMFSASATDNPSDWAREEVNAAEAEGLITDAVKKDYHKEITREEFCELVVKLYEKIAEEKAATGVDVFVDTNNPEIIKAYDLGIVHGISENEFAPRNNITRQEICTMLVRCIDVAIDGADIHVFNTYDFVDKGKIANWAIDSIYYSYQHGIMRGVGNNSIAPLDNTTCEQAILLVYRVFSIRNTLGSKTDDVYIVQFQSKLSSLIADIGVFSQNQDGTMHEWDDSWFNPKGVLSASVLDFDSDTMPEMLVCYTEPTNYDPATYEIRLNMYELSEGSVVLSDSIVFSAYHDDSQVDSWEALSSTIWGEMYLGIHPVWTEHGCVLMCEDIESYSAFADGSFQDYWILIYDNNKFQYLCSFTQTDGGSSGFEYTGFEFSNGVLMDSNLYYSEWEENSPLFDDFDTALREFFAKYDINVVENGMKSILTTDNNSVDLFEFQNMMVASDYLSSTFRFVANLYVGENDVLNR